MRAILNAHLLEDQELLLSAASVQEGLSLDQARLRLEDQGPNSLPGEARPSLPRRLLSQTADPMVIVLLLAALVSALFGQWADSLVIAVVVALNAALGVFQEGRAEKAVEALAKLNAPQALVRREGRLLRIPGPELVVGDIALLEAGDAAPADIRLLSGSELRVDQSSLTGESRPVSKGPGPLREDAPLAERANMVYMGSPILSGRGEGLVCACGGDTATGRIAALLAQTELTATPLQKKLAQLSRQLSLAVLAVCVLVFAVSLLTTEEHSASALLGILMLAISLAVAAVPEGLVVVVTLVLSLGMRAISKQRGVVRRLNAVETLGCTQVICSDKTGTLTQNRMKVTACRGLGPGGVRAAALCNSLPKGWEQAEAAAAGDPTERALAAFAREQGCPREELLARYPLVAELPFDSRRKRMSTLHQDPAGGYIQYSKGGPELLLACCDRWEDPEGRVHPLDPEARSAILEQQRLLSGQALRVLALAYAPRQQAAAVEEKLIFAGLAGLADPPREGVREALAQGKAAGIRTVMVSGDSLETAAAIGRELGILRPNGRVVSGTELDAMDEAELQRALPEVDIFARVKPEDKLRIVRGWQALGRVTAMTGDGVNDAPALKAADIGVGMGRCGSEVSRRVSALVLTDDDYGSIISAVREGRRIYANIRKALQFLLASNLAEVLVIFIASLLGWQVFLPIHLLWINLITDCFPAVALGAEEPEPQVMEEPPRRAEDGIFSGGLGRDVLWQGAAVALLTLLSFARGCAASPAAGMSMAFVTLSCGEVFHAWNMRSPSRSIFSLPGANRLLAASMALSFLLDLALLYIPALSGLFSVTALSASQLLVSLGLAGAIVPIVEAVKALRRREQTREEQRRQRGWLL